MGASGEEVTSEELRRTPREGQEKTKKGVGRVCRNWHPSNSEVGVYSSLIVVKKSQKFSFSVPLPSFQFSCNYNIKTGKLQLASFEFLVQ